MSCQETQGLLDAYLDGEIDLIASLEIERHLKDCADCQKQRAQHDLLRTALKQPGLYATAPAGLAERIQIRLEGGAKQKVQPVKARRSAPVWRWAAAGAGITALLVSSVVLLKDFSHRTAEETLAREVASSHIRSLMASHLTDVPSSDQHTVKPWFNGKLDFTPMVKDLAVRGFPLTGGRLDYLDERPVAALLYKRNQHPINLFEWPTEVVAQPQMVTVRGYNIIHWSDAGMNFWAISDLNARELNEFVRDLRQ